MKKILALVLAMVMCFSLLAACGSKDDAQNTGSTNTGTTNTGNAGVQTGSGVVANTGNAGEQGKVDETVKYKETVKISAGSEITNGAFYAVTTTQSSYISGMTHEGLVKYNYETGKADPALAKEWKDVNGDGKVWEFTLNEGIKFFKGDKEYGDLKASDVKYTYEYAAPDGQGVADGVIVRTVTQMTQIDKIETDGDYKVIFTLKNPMFDFPEAGGSWKILSEAAMKEFGGTDGQDIGTGPYYINFAESAQGQQWTLTRRDNYWGGIEEYATKNIVFVIHEDATTAVAAMKAGEVDLRMSIGALDALEFAADDTYKVISVSSTSLPSIFFNSYDGMGVFDGEDTEKQYKLRQAIKLAIDKDALCAVIYAANPAAGGRQDSLWHAATTGYAEPAPSEFNVEKAQALMKEIGYNENNRLHVKLAHYSSYATYGQIIQDMLKPIYIDVEMATLDTSIFGTTLRTGQGWDMAVNYYAPSLTISGVLTANLHTTGSNAKVYGWSSAEMDKRIDEILAKPTKDEQIKAFQEFQLWANDYNPRIPTHAGTVMHVMTADVEGVVACPSTGSQDWAHIRIPE